MDAALEALVRRRARFRCEYCLLPESLASTAFQFDHIIAQSHGGQTTAENLALACFHCNNFKGPNLAGVDPDTAESQGYSTPAATRAQGRSVWRARFSSA